MFNLFLLLYLAALRNTPASSLAQWTNDGAYRSLFFP